MTEVNTTSMESARPADLSRQTPGEYLRRLREEKGLTHVAVGQALHLTVHYIKALESDEYGKLPGLTFVKGYLRSYARFLGADVDNVIARFDEHIAGLLDAGMHTARVERSKRRQDQALRWAIGAGFVVVAGLAGGWWFMSERQAALETAQNAAAAQQSAQPAPAVAAAVTGTAQSLTSRNAPAPVSNVTPPPTQTFTPPITQTGVAGQQQVVTQLNTPQQNAIAPVSGGTAVATGAVTGAGLVANLSGTATNTPVATNTAQAASPPAGALPDSTATTPAPTNMPAVVSPNATGARQVSLIGAGDDELRVNFVGNSWIEVDDGSMVRVYQDMLSTGDTLTIRGRAPFHVLLGDAANVALSLNASQVDISTEIRSDRTARVVLGAHATTAPAAEQTPAAVTGQSSTAAQASTPAATTVAPASTPPAASPGVPQ